MKKEKEQKKVKTVFWIDKNLMDEIDELLPLARTESRSEFMKNAVKFYIGFLRTTRTESYLLTTFFSALSAIVGGTEERMERVLFRLAVEVAILHRIVAYEHVFSEEEIGEYREVAEKEVKSIIGYWGK